MSMGSVIRCASEQFAEADVGRSVRPRKNLAVVSGKLFYGDTEALRRESEERAARLRRRTTQRHGRNLDRRAGDRGP